MDTNLNNNAEELKEEFLNVFFQSQSVPIGSKDQAWEWMLDRIRYFREQGLDDNLLQKLIVNIVTNLEDLYEENFEDLIHTLGSFHVIISACEELLDNKVVDTGLNMIMPCLGYLKQHPEKYTNGQLCFRDSMEKSIYYIEYGRENDVCIADEDYTHWILLYLWLLDNKPCEDPDELSRRKQMIRPWLDTAVRLSPCNSSAWIEMAELQSDDPKGYELSIRNAMKYAYSFDKYGGFQKLYRSLAMHSFVKGSTLSQLLLTKAFFTMNIYCGDDSMAVRFLLSKINLPYMGIEDAILHIRVNNYYVGYSELVQKAREINNSNSSLDQETDIVEVFLKEAKIYRLGQSIMKVHDSEYKDGHAISDVLDIMCDIPLYLVAEYSQNPFEGIDYSKLNPEVPSFYTKDYVGTDTFIIS